MTNSTSKKLRRAIARHTETVLLECESGDPKADVKKAIKSDRRLEEKISALIQIERDDAAREERECAEVLAAATRGPG